MAELDMIVPAAESGSVPWIVNGSSAPGAMLPIRAGHGVVPGPGACVHPPVCSDPK